MDDAAGLDVLAEMLGGWPDHFGALELQHGRSLLARMRREKVVDEIIFGMVIRYADDRASYERITAAIRENEVEQQRPDMAITPADQKRSLHANKLAMLEKELLGTPYQRVKAGLPAQSTFIDYLVSAPKESGGDNTVTPFKPIGRRGA
jgi:hypothetical protein